MNCADTQNLLKDFLEGRLDAMSSRTVRTHLASCPGCLSGLSPRDRIEVIVILDEMIEPSHDIQKRFHTRLAVHRQAPPAGSSFRGLEGLPLVSWMRQLAAIGTLAAFLACGIYFGMYRVSAPGSVMMPAEIKVAEQLPLLQDLGVIKNLDILEDFDDIEALSQTNNAPSPIR